MHVYWKAALGQVSPLAPRKEAMEAAVVWGERKVTHTQRRRRRRRRCSKTKYSSPVYKSFYFLGVFLWLTFWIIAVLTGEIVSYYNLICILSLMM